MQLRSDPKGRDASAPNQTAKRSTAIATIAAISAAPTVHAKIARMERSREGTLVLTLIFALSNSQHLTKALK